MFVCLHAMLAMAHRLTYIRVVHTTLNQRRDGGVIAPDRHRRVLPRIFYFRRFGNGANGLSPRRHSLLRYLKCLWR